mmetsp:Transcript_20197/g.33352  ORF Transcript_20197/g.33352 Transcript_20197/m.33352 type:complete len:476 (-) Transcript_20197:1913-3340(-)
MAVKKRKGGLDSGGKGGGPEDVKTQRAANGIGQRIMFTLACFFVGLLWQTGKLQSIANTATDGAARRGLSGDSYVYERKKPDVTLMPASLESEYLVEDPTDFPYVSVYGSGNAFDTDQRAMGARFISFYDFPMEMYYDDGGDGVYSGTIQAGGMSTTNTYTTHRFIFRKKDSGEHVETLTMSDDEHLMVLGPDKNSPDYENVLKSEKYKKVQEERRFMKAYHDKNGYPWLSCYPRDPAILPFWPADFVGQTHQVRSYVGYFNNETSQSPEPIDFKIKVISVNPRIVMIENLLGPFEISHIKKAGLKVVRRSSVGNAGDGFESNTRTSDNGWLSRKRDHVFNTVYDRFADVMNFPDEFMKEHEAGEGNLEQLQFVRYKRDQKYDPHHDFGTTGEAPQRFATLFIYIQTPKAGGWTGFPKAFNGRGIKVKPPAGSAVLFYSMLPDGNGDDMSLHTGMAVEEGQKLAANLWSWDPHYR